MKVQLDNGHEFEVSAELGFEIASLMYKHTMAEQRIADLERQLAELRGKVREWARQTDAEDKIWANEMRQAADGKGEG